MSHNDTIFITNEGGNTLSNRLNRLLEDSTHFDVLVGYFFSSGFYKIYKSLEDVEKIRILVGISLDSKTYDLMEESKNKNRKFNTKDTEKFFKEKVIDELDHSEDTLDVEKGILKFIEWLQSGKLEIKVYPYDRIHAKVYILTFNEEDKYKGSVITGSSNFTSAGLNNNLEFNVELTNPADYNFSLQRFEKLWEKSVDVSEHYIETIQKDTWLNDNITPYDLYLKFLYEYLKDKINLDQELIDKYVPPGFLDLQYQRDAVIDAKMKLEEYGGVFLSDVVGVGKTYISALLAQQLDGKTLVIAPPVLLDESNPGSWPNVFREFGVRRYKTESWGKLDKLLEEGVDDYKNIFIDEAHIFKNEKTQRYTDLQRICRGKRVILVTATPLNNTPEDILSQILLFQNPYNSTLPNPKTKNLRAYFGSLQKKINKLDRQKDNNEYMKVVADNAKKIREDVLQYIMVRRTRKSIEKFYSKDLQDQGLKFLEVNDPIPVYYKFDKELNEIFDETLTLITKEFKYSRYMPLLYLKEEDTQIRAPQINMGKFMKVLLLKRLESSFHAFKKSINRFIKSYKQFIKAAEEGYVYFSSKDMNKVFEYLENDEMDKMEELINADKAYKYSIDLFKPNLIEDLHHDLKILIHIADLWKDFDSDPKLLELQRNLFNDDKLKNKIIIFTESQETGEYLTKNLNAIFNNKVLFYSGKSNEADKRKIIDNFDAKARKPKDDYRILITTDVLAEGVNLHASNVVINYDIPWNPTILMQRVGRVQRISSPFDEVFIYNFFPADDINDNIALKESAESKISAFIEMLGTDSKLLTDEDIKSHDLFEKLNSKKMLTEDDEDEDLELQYLHFLRDIRDNDKDLFEHIKRIPKKARTSKQSSSKGLLTFLRKGNLRKIYLNSKGKVTEIDFFQASELLQCSENTKSEEVPENYYDLLNQNKIAFTKLFDSNNTTNSYKLKNEKELLKYINAIENSSEFIDKDIEFIKSLKLALINGNIPKNICSKVMKDISTTNPLTILSILRRDIPSEFIYTSADINSNNIEKNEVILSEYLIGR